MVAVNLPDIKSGSMTFENILSTRVLKWLVFLLDCKISGNNESEGKESNN